MTAPSRPKGPRGDRPAPRFSSHLAEGGQARPVSRSHCGPAPADDDPDDPGWLAHLAQARVAPDAAGIYRDLGQSDRALTWERQAEAMPAGAFTRAGEQALAILANLHSTRSGERAVAEGIATIGHLLTGRP
ncbi:hypothetical protein [Kitasatospora griseola]|uniref:hypothetical protein n=1 Tax=Kitasatospora griseola TaxID=2064 RepID=UPI000A8E7BFA|nr:hypothetical protein [Kitasatospora griseola]